MNHGTYHTAQVARTHPPFWVWEQLILVVCVVAGVGAQVVERLGEARHEVLKHPHCLLGERPAIVCLLSIAGELSRREGGEGGGRERGGREGEGGREDETVLQLALITKTYFTISSGKLPVESDVQLLPLLLATRKVVYLERPLHHHDITYLTLEPLST